jgi:DNA-binding GntR family transcriptional regulator
MASKRGTADRVAQVLREEIANGLIPPGKQLSEESLGASLGVARNTLREAFRILSQERLVVHVLNRGVFVRELTVDDIADLYLIRRAVEVEALAVPDGKTPDDADLEPLRTALAAADTAAIREDWAGVGTADVEFHLGLVALAKSERLSEMMERLLAELRLAFHMASNVEELHGRYILRNKMLLKLIEEGDLRGAAAALRTYLADSQADILAAYSEERSAV